MTGADGFIGSHLVEQLVQDGYYVRAMVLYNSFNSWGWLDESKIVSKQNFEIISGDIRDAQSVNTAMKDMDCVLHLAALIAIPYSYHAPDAYVQTNITGTLNILNAARLNKLDQVVVTSTSETYGSAKFVPITETHELSAQSPYAATKIAADQLALSYHKSFGMPISVLRPFNTYGPRQSARAVIPTIIGQIASGKTTIKLGSLTPTRDFTFVEDTARGFIQAMNCEDCIGSVTNIGSGFEISIKETAQIIAEAMNVSVEFITDEERIRPELSEVDRLFASTELAKRRFGWQPKYAGKDGFLEGLKLTANWFQNPENLQKYKMDIYTI